MIPIGDTNSRNPAPALVTIALIVINVVIFFVEWTGNTQAIINTYGMIPANILNGDALPTLFTSMFLHGGWLHLIGNMLFLWVFGDNIEDTLGHVMYLVFYIAGGLAANAAHIFFNPASTIPSVGASGAIAAVLGAYIVMFPHSRVRVLYFLGFFMGVTRVAALLFLGIWFVTQLFNGLGAIGTTAQTAGIAFWAHIGGFVFGVLIGFLFRGRATVHGLQSG